MNDGVSKDNVTSFADARMARHRRRDPRKKYHLQSLIAALQTLPREARLNVIVGTCDIADWRLNLKL
jgi:hypothetical protein